MFPEFKIMVMHICTEPKTIIESELFSFSTTQQQLNYLRFPLGEINKSETRSAQRNLI